MKVTLDLPDDLHGLLQIEAILHKVSVEKRCVDNLAEIIQSRIQSDWYEHWIRRFYNAKKAD